MAPTATTADDKVKDEQQKTGEAPASAAPAASSDRPAKAAGKPTLLDALRAGQTIWLCRMKGHRPSGAGISMGGAVQTVMVLATTEAKAREVAQAWAASLGPNAMILSVMPGLVADESILAGR